MKVGEVMALLAGMDQEADVHICLEDSPWPGYEVQSVTPVWHTIGIATKTPRSIPVVVLST